MKGIITIITLATINGKHLILRDFVTLRAKKLIGY